MDSRDIREEPIKVVGGRYLECIYSLQKELLDSYIKIEGLPQYPVDVNTKKSQVLLKDFTSRVVEELAEGYEALCQISEIAGNNKLFHYDFDDNQYIQVLNHLQNVSEEMADAMHFMVELLIYANIQPEDINSYISNVFLDKKAAEYYNKSFGGNVIKKAMLAGGTEQMLLNILPSDDSEDYSDIYKVDLWEHIDEVDYNIDRRFIKCGRYYHNLIYLSYRQFMWEVTYHLNIARNYLKNKPWKQSQMMTNEQGYQEELVKSFIMMMGLYYIMGINDEDLYFLYFKKNRVNKFRIQSAY